MLLDSVAFELFLMLMPPSSEDAVLPDKVLFTNVTAELLFAYTAPPSPPPAMFPDKVLFVTEA